jgi:hypothetical protein
VKRAVGNDQCRAFFPCRYAGTVAHVSQTFVKAKSATEPGHILKVSAKVFGWCAGSTDLAAHRNKSHFLMCPVQRVPEMASYENDLKSERLKLPASSLWIPCITVFLVVLGVVISLT